MLREKLESLQAPDGRASETRHTENQQHWISRPLLQVSKSVLSAKASDPQNPNRQLLFSQGAQN
jgi:hypothetical protein